VEQTHEPTNKNRIERRESSSAKTSYDSSDYLRVSNEPGGIIADHRHSCAAGFCPLGRPVRDPMCILASESFMGVAHLTDNLAYLVTVYTAQAA
jgi:hypothetical protein